MSAGRARVFDLDEVHLLPDRVFVPARPGGPRGPLLEARDLSDGRVGLPVYSSLGRVIRFCGGGQPWILVNVDRLPALRRVGGFHVVVLDAEVPPDARHSADEARWDDAASPDWELAYLPSRRFTRGDPTARLELQPMPAERLAVAAYTSEPVLRAGCGPGQPWVSVPAGLLDEVRRQAGADTIMLDTALPARLRHSQARES